MTSFRITNGQLASIVSEILTNPFSGEVDDQAQFERFCTDIAAVICDYCGGQVVQPAQYDPKAESLDWSTHYRLMVQDNESSPDGGGVWRIIPAAVAEDVSKNSRSSVPVRYWDCYNAVVEARNTHRFDVDDQRRTNGQMFLDLGAEEGHPDDMLAVTMEVNTNPLNGIDHVPCAHVHFDGDNLAVSLFKVGNRILVRPEVNVTIEPIRESVGGIAETLYWID